MTPVIDPTTAKLEREFKFGKPLIACRFDPSGRFLFASSEDDQIRRVDLLSGEVALFSGHKSWVRGIAFRAGPKLNQARADVVQWQKSRDGLLSIVGGRGILLKPPPSAEFTAITGDYHGRLLGWRGDQPQLPTTIQQQAHDGWCRAVAVSPDGTMAASCGNDHLVKLWSTANGSLLQTFAGHQHHVYNVAFHPTEPRLVSCDLKGILLDWDLKSGKVARELDAKILHKYDTGFRADIGGARGLAFAADGSRFACAGITNVSNAFAGVGNPLIVVVDWKDGKAKHLKTKDAFQGTAWGVALLPGGLTIAAGGGNGGRVWFWKGDDPTCMHTLTVPANARDLAIDVESSRFAVAGANGTAYVYGFRKST